MTYSLHPAAEQDLAEALDFYAEQAGRLVAGRLLSEFERVAAFKVEHPDVGTAATRGRRVFPSMTYVQVRSGKPRAQLSAYTRPKYEVPLRSYPGGHRSPLTLEEASLQCL